MGFFVTPSSSQNTSESDSNIPLNVTNPQNKQDFIQQCSQNLQAQGKLRVMPRLIVVAVPMLFINIYLKITVIFPPKVLF